MYRGPAASHHRIVEHTLLAGPHRYRSARWAFAALAWAAVFAVAHGYWYLGGRVGLGDSPKALPDAPNSVATWMVTGLVGSLFFAGLAVPAALVWNLVPGVPRGVLVAAMWAGCVVLVIRGGFGLLDELVRDLGIADGGLTGLSYLQTLGIEHPSSYTLASTAVIDGYFLMGGVVFGQAARRHMGQSRAPLLIR